MIIFKSKEIRLLWKAAAGYEVRLDQLECNHNDFIYNDHRPHWRDTWRGADIRCKICGRVMQKFDDEAEFLKAKHAMMNEVIENDNKRLVERAKDKKRGAG